MKPPQLLFPIPLELPVPETAQLGSFYEFFAGGGMARAGLGPNWRCLFANDICAQKAAAYRLNWGEGELELADVGALTSADLPGAADLAWASFPCQDLSLAGNGAGLKGERSGTFWSFWRLMQALRRENRAPRLIVLENVCGALTSHDGKDFHALIAALAGENYRCGALVLDAALFVPQSRPRLFIVAAQAEHPIAPALHAQTPTLAWTPPALLKAHASLDSELQASWLWWNVPTPPARVTCFADILEDQPTGIDWHTPAQTAHLLSLMSPLHRYKVERAQLRGHRAVGAIYRRTRPVLSGMREQRAEVRFDDLAGCLRTPSGGSSRQTILIVEGNTIRSRLLSPREAARLMGLPDSYRLPSKYNDAYHLAGDGVAVPVVRYLAASLLEPLLASMQSSNLQAA